MSLNAPTYRLKLHLQAEEAHYRLGVAAVAAAATAAFQGRSLNASRCRFVVAGQLPAVLDGVPLPLLAEEVVQFAALLQLLVLLGQLQLLLVGCGTQSHVHRVRRRLGSLEPPVNTISVSKTRLTFTLGFSLDKLCDIKSIN